MRVLVIEDDEEMARGDRVRPAPDGHGRGRRARRPGRSRALAVNDYDVIVLDRDLPGMHGDELCAKLVDSECRSRVLMLTAGGDDRRPGRWARPRRGRLSAKAI